MSLIPQASTFYFLCAMYAGAAASIGHCFMKNAIIVFWNQRRTMLPVLAFLASLTGFISAFSLMYITIFPFDAESGPTMCRRTYMMGCVTFNIAATLVQLLLAVRAQTVLKGTLQLPFMIVALCLVIARGCVGIFGECLAMSIQQVPELLQCAASLVYSFMDAQYALDLFNSLLFGSVFVVEIGKHIYRTKTLRIKDGRAWLLKLMGRSAVALILASCTTIVAAILIVGEIVDPIALVGLLYIELTILINLNSYAVHGDRRASEASSSGGAAAATAAASGSDLPKISYGSNPMLTRGSERNGDDKVGSGMENKQRPPSTPRSADHRGRPTASSVIQKTMGSEFIGIELTEESRDWQTVTARSSALSSQLIAAPRSQVTTQTPLSV